MSLFSIWSLAKLTYLSLRDLHIRQKTNDKDIWHIKFRHPFNRARFTLKIHTHLETALSIEDKLPFVWNRFRRRMRPVGY